jgi:hypothetical protein
MFRNLFEMSGSSLSVQMVTVALASRILVQHDSALGKTPFEVLYGHPPRHFGIVPADASSITDLQEWLNERSVRDRSPGYRKDATREKKEV